jgi:GNAT superfamily N-acetyltransferase
MNVVNIRENPQYKEAAINYIQKKWASEASKPVYEDCISRSIVTDSPLPIWYLLMVNDRVIGCVGLITNDFISCMDLWPWLCAMYIEEEYRGNNYGSLLINELKKDAKRAGFSKVYLSTDHTGYYEKYGFEYLCTGFHPWGESSRVYECWL